MTFRLANISNGVLINSPQWHLRRLEGDSVEAECTSCPFPTVGFKVSKVGAPGAIISELQRQFDEHCDRVHQAAVETRRLA